MKHENANRVFLLNRDGKPLMPCRPRKGAVPKRGRASSRRARESVHAKDLSQKQKKPQDPLPSSSFSQQSARQA